MLVCSGMEHVVRTETAEDVLHAQLSGDRRNDGFRLDVWIALRHHQAYVVLRSLGTVDEHQFARIELAELLHNLATNTARRTRHEDTLAMQRVGYALKVDAYFVTRQQIFDAHLLQRGIGRSRVPLLISTRHKNMHTISNEQILQSFVITKHPHRTLRNKQAFHFLLMYESLNIIIAVNMQAHKHFMANLITVRHKAEKAHTQRLVVAHELSQSHATLVNAKNDCRTSVKRVD